MTEKLLQKIAKLEDEIEHIKNNNLKVIEELKKLCAECKVEKGKKEKFKSKLIKCLNALKIETEEKSFSDGILDFKEFLNLLSGSEDVFILTIDLNMEKDKQKYIYGYFVKKFNPVFSIKDNILYGVIEKKDLEEIKKLNKLPFFNPLTQEFDEIELFKIIFITSKFDFKTFEKIKKIFNDLRNRPSFRKKHFIVYSIDKNRVIDFEMEEMLKEKEKYSYIYEETYPSLEIKLKNEVKNAAFVLSLLERIDEEIDEIKTSRGIINVVNRILNYIDLHTNEEEIRKIVNSLKNTLKN
jgi:hypothetical protein